MPLNPKAIPFTIDASKNTLQQKLAETERLLAETREKLEEGVNPGGRIQLCAERTLNW